MRRALGLAFVLLAAQARADERLSGAGESCRAKADCAAGLDCVGETCVAPGAAKPEPARGETPEGGGSAGARWLAFALEGVHPFVGLEWSGGPEWAGTVWGQGSQFARWVDGGFLFALRGGVHVGRHELAAEVSPFTYVPTLPRASAVLQANGSYAYFAPIYSGESVHVYWPLRAGVGVMAGANNTNGLVYFQARADVVGVAVQIGHVTLDFHAPSFRYFLTSACLASVTTTCVGATGHVFTWLSGMSASYVF